MVFESRGSKNLVYTRVYKVFGARGLKNLSIFKVSDLSSTGRFVDIGQERIRNGLQGLRGLKGLRGF